MIFAIPKSDIHSQVKITARTSRGSAWSQVFYQDNSLKTIDIKIPQDICVDNVEVFVEFLFESGVPDHKVGATVLKTMKRAKLPPRTPNASS